jgi:predicted O-linked N-acetylglucosamine transferase (SPINDLY family)
MNQKNEILFEQALAAFNNRNYSVTMKNLLSFLKNNPTNIDGYHLLGVTLALMNDHKNALKYYKEAINLKTNDAQIFSNYASSLSEIGDYENALNAQKKALLIEPNNHEYLYNAGNILCALGYFNDSLIYYQNALKINQTFAPIYNNYGKALFDLKRFSESLEYFDQALKIDPYYLNCLNNKGIALKELKYYDESMNVLQIAYSINNNHAETLSNIGIVLCALNKFKEALNFFQRAVELKPNYAEAWSNKGAVFNYFKKFNDAISCHDRALNIAPTYAEAWSNKATSLVEINKYSDALKCYEKALVLKPEFEWIFGNVIHTKMKLGLWNDYENDLNKLINDINSRKKSVQPFVSLFSIDDPSIHKQCAEIYVSSLFSTNQKLEPFDNKLTRNKIRLGYFSADFGSHAVSSLIVELLEFHNKNLFEIIGFSFSKNDGGTMYSRVSNTFDEFIQIDDMSDREVAILARNKQIDIAIDLGGFTGANRFGPFAFKLAPIQVNYLGYPGTSGSDFMDYVIADKTLIPEEQRNSFSEKIVYLPDCYQPNDSTKVIKHKFQHRSELDLPENSFVFCCFNNNYKIQPNIFKIWMHILSIVDHSVLWLLMDDDALKTNLSNEAKNLGIDPDRLIYANRLPVSEHLGRHAFADLFLDTFPYNAHTTASEALWSGLPLLTLQGKSFASRVASSLLKAMDLPELICQSQDEYKSKAIFLAKNPAEISELKRKISQNKYSSPLFNTKLMTQNLEAAYTKMYQAYLEGRNLDHMYI